MLESVPWAWITCVCVCVCVFAWIVWVCAGASMHMPVHAVCRSARMCECTCVWVQVHRGGLGPWRHPAGSGVADAGVGAGHGVRGSGRGLTVGEELVEGGDAVEVPAEPAGLVGVLGVQLELRERPRQAGPTRASGRRHHEGGAWHPREGLGLLRGHLGWGPARAPHGAMDPAASSSGGDAPAPAPPAHPASPEPSRPPSPHHHGACGPRLTRRLPSWFHMKTRPSRATTFR